MAEATKLQSEIKSLLTNPADLAWFNSLLNGNEPEWMNSIYANTFSKPNSNNALSDDEFIRMIIIFLMQEFRSPFVPVVARCSCNHSFHRLPP